MIDGKRGSSNVPEGWKGTRLEEIARIKSGSTPSRAQGERYFDANGTPWVKTMDLNNGYIDETDESITDDALRESACSVFPQGSVLVAMYGGYNQIGRTGLLRVDAAVNQAISALQISSNDAISEYVLHWLNTHVDVWKQFAASSRKDPNITRKDVCGFPILLPPLEEQRKIAAILSAWDEAIEQQTRLIELKRERKRGLMQQLLTGRLRFTEFAGLEWGTKSFENTYRTVNGKKYQIQKADYADAGAFPVVDQGQSQIAGFTDNTNVFDDVPIIVFGDHTRIIKWVDFPFAVGADGTQLLKTANGIDQNFGFYLLQTAKLPNLGYSRHMRELKQKTLFIPTSFEEQQKIATVLSVADAELETLTAQLAALKTQKRGMMQRLLTGKTRVQVA